MHIRFYLFLLIILLVSQKVVSQTEISLNKSSQKKIILIEQVLSDSHNLKLPSNKAIAYAEIADKLWEIDQTRAKSLFSQSIEQLLIAQNEISKEKEPDKFRDLYYGKIPRRNILNLIGERDAEFALISLYKSRPQIISETLNKYSKDAKNPLNGNIRKIPQINHHIRWELEDEQNYKLLAAKQNPNNVTKFFRESLKSGVTGKTIQFLHEQNKTNPKLANKLAEETAKQLIDLELSRKHPQNYRIFQRFFSVVSFQIARRDYQLKISEESYYKLADKISAIWLNEKWGLNISPTIFRNIERFFPERVASLRRKNAERKKIRSNQYSNSENARYNKLKLSNPTAEEILEQIDNFSGYKNSLYSLAIEKYRKQGDVESAIRLIRNTNSKSRADYKISSIYKQLAIESSRKGNTNQSFLYIDKIPRYTTKIEGLVEIAKELYKKNPEKNQGLAESFLYKGFDYLYEENETSPQINWFIKLATGFAEINPSKAFSMTESVIPKINQYNRAFRITSGFLSGSSRFSDEFFLHNSGAFNSSSNLTGKIYLDGVLSQLILKDFDRTVALINRFEFPETRLKLKLNLLVFLKRNERTQ